MASNDDSPTLSHEELAALDLIIMRAIQRGAKPNDVLSFIDVIGDAFNDAAHFVADHVDDVAKAVEVAGHVAEVTAEVTEAVGLLAQRAPAPAVDAIKSVVTATAKSPSRLTLQQLMDVRRKAVEASRSSGGSSGG
jgi:hypothetical protein